MQGDGEGPAWAALCALRKDFYWCSTASGARLLMTSAFPPSHLPPSPSHPRISSSRGEPDCVGSWDRASLHQLAVCCSFVLGSPGFVVVQAPFGPRVPISHATRHYCVLGRPFATEYRDSTLLTSRVVPGRNVISNGAIYSESLLWHRKYVTGK